MQHRIYQVELQQTVAAFQSIRQRCRIRRRDSITILDKHASFISATKHNFWQLSRTNFKAFNRVMSCRRCASVRKAESPTSCGARTSSPGHWYQTPLSIKAYIDTTGTMTKPHVNAHQTSYLAAKIKLVRGSVKINKLVGKRNTEAGDDHTIRQMQHSHVCV